MKSPDSTVAKAHHPDMEQPQTGQATLLVLAGRLPTRGKLGKENVCRRHVLGPWRLTAVQRITRHEMRNEEEEEDIWPDPLALLAGLFLACYMSKKNLSVLIYRKLKDMGVHALFR